MSDLNKLIKDAKTVAVVCTQWGDTGKGKFVDWLAEWADIIARGTGGANAGHTICLGDDTHVFHLVPCGILHDAAGKLNLIGRGVAFDPQIFEHEVGLVEAAGLSTKGLFVSHAARLVMPQHYLLDRLRESGSGQRIGTTGRGIGPTYVDHYARVGLTVNDLLNVDSLSAKLERNLVEKRLILKAYDPALIETIMSEPTLGNGAFWTNGGFNNAAIIEQYRRYGQNLRQRIKNIDRIMAKAVGHKNILLEGAQGNLLSVDYGSYPYVTASDCSVAGLAHGVGISEQQVDLTLGIVKAPYMTRVGAGPFPTEMGGEASELWCASPAGVEEAKTRPEATINDTDPFAQGIAIRRAGGEYGATTGRPRRVGWLDLPLLRYSKGFTGDQVILTKIDVLDNCDTIKICHSYLYEGPDYFVGETKLTTGDEITTAIPDSLVLRHCTPQYTEFAGWCTATTNAKTVKDLPPKLLKIIQFIEQSAGVSAVVLSIGPDRDQTIVTD